jgi:hypothetical protein
MPCPSHPPWLDHSNYVWQRVQVMKLLIMQFPQFLLWHHLSSDIIFSSAPCSQTPSVSVPPLMLRDQVSHPYRTTGKIIIIWYLYWKCWEVATCNSQPFRRWEDNIKLSLNRNWLWGSVLSLTGLEWLPLTGLCGHGNERSESWTSFIFSTRTLHPEFRYEQSDTDE